MKDRLSIPLSSFSSSSSSNAYPHRFRFHFGAALGICCIFSGSLAEEGVLGILTSNLHGGRSGSS